MTTASGHDDTKWRPRRRRVSGVELFCSSRCGGGCTRAAYDAAHRNGDHLARKLGAGWTVDVWENLGWHYQVLSPCGRFRVCDDSRKDRPHSTYTAYLGDADGSAGGRWARTADSPEEAILEVAREAVADLHKIGAVFLDMPFQARLSAPPPKQIESAVAEANGVRNRP